MSNVLLESESFIESVAQESQYEEQKLRGESTLSESVAILIVFSILQRVVSLVRGLWVPTIMVAASLGQWELSNSFLVYAAPLVVLGIPGSFGRYLEYYRQRGALKSFLWRSTIASLVLTGIAYTALMTQPAYFAELAFGSASHAGLMRITATCLVAVIAFNYLSELFTALRMARLNAFLQFFTTIGFAILSIGLLYFWRNESTSIVIAYGVSCLLLVLYGCWYLNKTWQELPNDRVVIGQREFWAKLLPFAFWIWATNTLTNSFEYIGRYMIVHYINIQDFEAVLGNLHTARIVPALMITLANLIGSTLLPFLSREWELQNRERVSSMVNLALKMVTLLCLIGSVMVLCLDSVLFDWWYKGKFSLAKDVFHLTLMCSTFSSIFVIANTYLWCAEKARQGSIALAIGIVINIGLNVLLLPIYGLAGSLVVNGVATIVVLGIVFAFSHHWGLKLQRRTLLITLLPVLLMFGLWPTIVALSLVAIETLFHGRLVFSDPEREQLAVACESLTAKVRGLIKAQIRIS